ncbi:MAG: hypothetical protein Q8N39_01000 [Pelolinea sp.]|nr:hypothetical protein [Pelolinea sp.]
MAVSEKIIKNLESRLDDFDRQVRKESLEALNELARNGDVSIEPEREVANLHCHSFFSYNGYGYSPTHLAWLGKRNGLKFMGVVDFDVLDGVDEFLDACEYLGIRGTAGMETRVFIPEFAEIEINSPGEPGVYYHMGIGFTSSSAPATANRILEDIRLRVAQRNCRILEKINQFLDPLIIDFERDILPMTPSGNATERHIVTKIADEACAEFENPAQYWSDKLGMPLEAIQNEMEDPEVFQNTIRKKLMKRGGVGYIQPTADTFPLIDEFYRVVFACQAMPCAAWLDGTTPGEQAIEKLLGVLIDKGTAAINVIPERNWNFKDPKEKALKLENLYHVTRVAADLDLPILVGTEMNSFGQKMVDDFNIPELVPLKDEFIKGADFLYGHTQMQKRWEMGYQSPWALKYFKDRKSKNEFFTSAGRMISSYGKALAGFEGITTDMTPEEVLARLKLNED